MCKCAICNRELTNPESVRLEIGPICRARLDDQAQQGHAEDDFKVMLSLYDYPLDEEVRCIRHEDGVKATNVPHIVTRHSPTGYEWGYGGSGPAELALNICEYYVRVLRNEGVDIGKAHNFREGVAHDMALKVYQEFKATFIAGMPHSGGAIKANYIMSWIKERIPNQQSLL